jgi:hypothetical protein
MRRLVPRLIRRTLLRMIKLKLRLMTVPAVGDLGA